METPSWCGFQAIVALFEHNMGFVRFGRISIVMGLLKRRNGKRGQMLVLLNYVYYCVETGFLLHGL